MDANDFLQKNNIKVTKARIYIYCLLCKCDDAVTAEYIYNMSKQDNIRINLSTVYRTLEIFEKSKIVEKFNIGENSFVYSIVHNQHNHVLKCSMCDKEIEFPCPMKQIEELVKSQTGFTLTEHHFIFKGICEDCSKKINSKDIDKNQFRE